MSGTRVILRSLEPRDDGWVRRNLVDSWGSTQAARLGELVELVGLPGFLAVVDGEPRGLALIALRHDDCELASLAVEVPRQGLGTALLGRCVEEASAHGCRRLWLTTTNNNIAAYALYTRFGLDLSALHRDGVAASRRVKPTIPLVDEQGVAMRHELEFQLLL